MKKPGYMMMPYKVVWCTDQPCLRIGREATIPIRDLPRNPTPGRMPVGCTHVHIVARMSAERAEVDIREWRRIAFSTLRCDHGQLTGTSCNRCDTWVDRVGVRIGTLAGPQSRIPVITPPVDLKDDPNAWFRRDLVDS